MYIYACIYMNVEIWVSILFTRSCFGVATMSRLLKIIGLFCKIDL